MVALLTALVSVVATSLPIIRDIIRGDHSDMKLTFEKVDEEGITLLGFNSGTKPGSVAGGAKMTLTKAGETREIPLSGGWHRDGKNVDFLDPGQGARLILHGRPLSERDRDPAFKPDGYSCAIKIETAESGRSNRSVAIEKPCSELRSALEDRVAKLPQPSRP
jgi:hypothetical protein